METGTFSQEDLALATTLQSYRTDALEHLAERARTITDLDLLPEDRPAFWRMTRARGLEAAGARVRGFAARVLELRERSVERGLCPVCNRPGTVTTYDGGAYSRTGHSGTGPGFPGGFADGGASCYFGPSPLAPRFTGPLAPAGA